VSVLQALRVPGTVTFDGQDLGLLRDVMLNRTAPRTPIEPEEFGVEVVDQVFVGADYEIGLALRGFETAVVAKVFPNIVAGQVTYPGAKKAGYFLSQDAAALTFTPIDSNHPPVTFAMAIPGPAEVLEVSLAHRTEFLLLCKFRSIRDSATPEGSVAWGL